MKFDEVINHIGKTYHLIAANEFTISLKKWNSMTPSQQNKVQECANNFEAALDASTLDLEKSLEQDMIKNGMIVYDPDKAAFQEHIVEEYRKAGKDKNWPEGLMEKIVAIGK